MEHLNSAISVGERESMFLSDSPPKSQLSKLPQARASTPQKQKHPNPRAKLVPGGSLDSEGESHTMTYSTQIHKVLRFAN